MSHYFVYILRSFKTGQYYIGQTNNLTDRLVRHNEGRVSSTKAARPWELMVYFQCVNRGEFLKLERKLKSLKNRRSLESYIKNNSGEQEA